MNVTDLSGANFGEINWDAAKYSDDRSTLAAIQAVLDRLRPVAFDPVKPMTMEQRGLDFVISYLQSLREAILNDMCEYVIVTDPDRIRHAYLMGQISLLNVLCAPGLGLSGEIGRRVEALGEEFRKQVTEESERPHQSQSSLSPAKIEDFMAS